MLSYRGASLAILGPQGGVIIQYALTYLIFFILSHIFLNYPFQSTDNHTNFHVTTIQSQIEFNLTHITLSSIYKFTNTVVTNAPNHRASVIFIGINT